MSWQLPRPPLRRGVLIAQALGLSVAIGTTVLVTGHVGAGPALPARAAVVAAAIGLIAIGFVQSQHPFDRFGPANWVTTIRAALVAAAAALLGELPSSEVAGVAAALAVLVAALDFVDGWVARRTGLASAFGARFDMEVDALLILVLAVMAWTHGKAGLWILLAGAMRYLFVLAGWLWNWISAPLPPSRRRKAICVVQIVGLAVMVSPVVATPASVVVGLATLASLTWSFALDTLWLRRHSA